MYPPVTNLIRALVCGGMRVQVHTTRNHFEGEPFACEGSLIHRNSSPAQCRAVKRLCSYAWFQMATLARLIAQRPDAVIYVEPSSAFPVFLYSLLRPEVPVFIHHHEYHSPEQFLRPGMRLIRWFHRLEVRRLLPRARWVSHTNAKRLDLFCHDCPGVAEAARRLLPNYPPAAWREGRNTAWLQTQGPFRFVYVGSLSLRDTFLGGFVRWLLAQPRGSVRFDVYAYNVDAETRRFLEEAHGEVIRFFPKGVAYDDLPGVLRQYHAGVILYRAETLNYRYNETNKLFEYLICGLDVWYSHRMEGIRPHARMDTYPRIIECDFEAMESRDWTPFLARSAGAPLGPAVPDAESACAILGASLQDLTTGA